MLTAFSYYWLLLPELVLFIGLGLMVSAIWRQSTSRIRAGMFTILGAGLVGLLLFIYRILNADQLSAADCAMLVLGVLLLASVGLGIVYSSIHRVLPDFFVNSSLATSVSLLITIGIVFNIETEPAADRDSAHRFVESQEYQLKEARSQARFASNVEPANLPQ